jgi:heat shock protein HslJ
VPPALQGAWQLVSLQVGGQAAVPAPSGHAFTADFGADGRVSLVADCNRCGGGFAASGGTLDVGSMACTLAYCSTAPLDTQYAGLVQSAKQWSVTGSELSLESSAGTVRLRRP